MKVEKPGKGLSLFSANNQTKLQIGHQQSAPALVHESAPKETLIDGPKHAGKTLLKKDDVYVNGRSECYDRVYKTKSLSNQWNFSQMAVHQESQPRRNTLDASDIQTPRRKIIND